MNQDFDDRKQLVCITPYTEFHSGSESILDHTEQNYVVPEKVIAYLRVGNAYMVCMGIYDHPFKPETQLLGPYYYTDGHYYWDRDTWKYVLKYGLVLPEEFINHVMSKAGTHFIEERMNQDDQWSETIKQWKKKKDFLCLMPENAGNIDLEDF